MPSITQPDHIKFMQLCTWRSALRLEILGMKRNGPSVFSIVKSELGLKGTKQQVFNQLLDLIEKRRAELNLSKS